MWDCSPTWENVEGGGVSGGGKRRLHPKELLCARFFALNYGGAKNCDGPTASARPVEHAAPIAVHSFFFFSHLFLLVGG